MAKLKALETARSHEEQKKKALESAKTEMAKAINEVVEMHKEMVEYGLPKDFLKEPQFHEFTSYLGISFDGARRGSRSSSRTDWTDTILNLLKSGPKTAAEIKTACDGRQQIVKLDTLIEAKKVKKEGNKKTGVKYSLA